MSKIHTKSNSAKVKERRKSCITVPWLTGSDSESDSRHMTSMEVKNKSCEAFLKIVTNSFCRKFYDVNAGFTE